MKHHILLLVALMLLSAGVGADPPPPTVNIQGSVTDSGGTPLSGSREYRVRFFDMETGGSQLGLDLTGVTLLSSGGVFDFEIVLPVETLSEPSSYYELALDTDSPTDGIDISDVFADRFKVNSVPFALLAANANLLGGSPASSFLTIQNASGAFVTTANVTSNSPGDLANDDFVFGSDQLDDDGIAAHDARVSFDKSKGAFRAGQVTSNQWDSANVGSNSVAMGRNTTASGQYSTAMGFIYHRHRVRIPRCRTCVRRHRDLLHRPWI